MAKVAVIPGDGIGIEVMREAGQLRSSSLEMASVGPMTRSQVTSSFERARTDTPLSNAEKVQETPARNAQETLRSQDTSSFVDEGFTVVDDWEEEDQLVAHSKRKASVDPSSRNPKRTHSTFD